MHELAHYVHYKKIGPEKYIGPSLTTAEKEPFVYDRLRNSRKIWNALNDDEQRHAMKDILGHRGRTEQRFGGRHGQKR